MESKTIVLGIIIGLIIGSGITYLAIPKLDISAINNQIIQLENKVESYENQIVELQQEVNQLTDNLAEKNTQLTEKTTDYTLLRSDYNQIKMNYDELFSNHTSLQEIYIELEEKFERILQLYNYTVGPWNTIKIWSGSSSKTTELFSVSNQIKISWNNEMGDYSALTITLYTKESVIKGTWMINKEDPKGETFAYVTPGLYYLEINPYYCRYEIRIEELPL